MRKCNNCGTEFYNPATTVCNVCGSKLPMPLGYNITNEIKECSRCGFTNQVNSLFCSNCGYSFNTSQQNSTPNTPNTDKENTNDKNITNNRELVDNTQSKEESNEKGIESDNDEEDTDNVEENEDEEESTNNTSISDTYQTQPPVENLLNKKNECSRCGFDNPVNNIFCSNCGNKLNENISNYYKEQEKKQEQDINNNQQEQYNNNANNTQTQNQYNQYSNQKPQEESFLKKTLPFILFFVFIGISSIIYFVTQNTDNFEKVSADYNVIMKTKFNDLATNRDLDKYIESLANIHVRIKKLLEKEKDSAKISTLYEYDKKISVIYDALTSLRQTINNTIQKYTTVNNLDSAKKCKNELNYIYNESGEYMPKILYTLIEEKFNYCHSMGINFVTKEMYNHIDTLANKMNKKVADKYVGRCMWRVKGNTQEISKNRETHLDGLTLYVTAYYNVWEKCLLGKEFTDIVKMNGKIFADKNTFEIKYSY